MFLPVRNDARKLHLPAQSGVKQTRQVRPDDERETTLRIGPTQGRDGRQRQNQIAETIVAHDHQPVDPGQQIAGSTRFLRAANDLHQPGTDLHRASGYTSVRRTPPLE